jgi:polyhydroxyalkanoate synthesis repressor PhaR
MEKERPIRVVKRYQNRKLYDTQNSCYVTLDEIGQMVKQGEDVKIVDNRTGDDLTSVTLTQIIFEEEKKKKSLLPLATLKKIIQSGGESIVEFFQKTVNTGVSSISNVKDEAEKVIDKIKDEFEDGGTFVREILHRAHKTVDELQRKMEEKFKLPLVGNVRNRIPQIKGEMRALRKKMAGLERKLKEYQK